MPEIRLERLVKRYGDVEVLHGIDLTFADNEFTVLVGPSGCGKSTTLRMVAGLEDVTDGRILIGDRDVTALQPKDRDIAMVVQDYALEPHMTVARNMSCALRLARYPRAEIDERVKRVAQMLDIRHLLQRKPGELSGGQRQRVAMGRALVRDASVFLFDEPLSNLDAKLRGQMRAELALMRKRVEKNMIYVTHDQIEAMTLGDRIVVMHGGHIQQQGTPEELYKRPANLFVAGFIGSPPMNFLDAELDGAGDRLRAVGKGFGVELDGATARGLKKHASKSVRIGIRPPALRSDPVEGANAVDLDVVVSEYLGSSSVLLTRCGGTDVLVDYPSSSPVPASGQLRFFVKPSDIYVFDPGSGKRL